MEGYRRLQYEAVLEFTRWVFTSYGLSEEDSRTAADILLCSDLMGIESHGLQRLNMYYTGIKLGRIHPKAKMGIVSETPVSAVIDANEGFGQIAGKKGMDLAIEKARRTGIGFVLVKNSTHYGIAGYYSMMAAKEGMLGISMTNTEALVVPTFGRTPVCGTNPIAVTMPAKPYPLHIDMATSVVPAGKIEVYNKKQKPVPEGWILNADGEVSTVAQEFIDIRANKTDGGLLPLGGAGELHSGHKGYALSMIVELMTAILSGGYTSYFVRRVPGVEKCCHMFMAIDYSMFGDKKEIEEGLSSYLHLIRNSNKAKGHDRIFTHGEKELEKFEWVKEHGVLVNDKTFDELKMIAKDFHIPEEGHLVVMPEEEG